MFGDGFQISFEDALALCGSISKNNQQVLLHHLSGKGKVSMYG